MKKKVWRELPGKVQTIAIAINEPQCHSTFKWIDIEQPGGDFVIRISDCELQIARYQFRICFYQTTYLKTQLLNLS